MEKMSRKPTFKVPPGVIERSTLTAKSPLSGISKWVPLICAGTAIGVSMLALKEIKNTRRELILLKKEQYTAPNNDKLEKKIELLEKQLSKVTEFLKTQSRAPPPPPPPPQRKKPEVVKNVVPTPPADVKIINEEEYEEVEVTDDEEEEDQN